MWSSSARCATSSSRAACSCVPTWHARTTGRASAARHPGPPRSSGTSIRSPRPGVSSCARPASSRSLAGGTCLSTARATSSSSSTTRSPRGCLPRTSSYAPYGRCQPDRLPGDGLPRNALRAPPKARLSDGALSIAHQRGGEGEGRGALGLDGDLLSQGGILKRAAGDGARSVGPDLDDQPGDDRWLLVLHGCL